jgi:hypothetical protein
MNLTGEVSDFLTGSLRADGYDYDAEVILSQPGSIAVVLHGDAMRWCDEGPRVVAKLRDSEPYWRPYGVEAKYRFLDRNALRFS